MSVTQGHVEGGGAAGHLQCSYCGHLSSSHFHKLSHLAASHPTCLDDIPVGRLGNILMYQSTARLFHCSNCFFTSWNFVKLFKHIVSKHCMNDRLVGDDGSDGEEKDKTVDEGKEEEEKNCLKRKRSSEAEEDEDRERQDEEPEVEKPNVEGDERSQTSNSTYYRCFICGWKNKLKAVGVNHVIRKHDIPKAYAGQALKRDLATPQQPGSSGPVDEVVTEMSRELLKEEMEATAKVVRFVSGRFECLFCGWKTKRKGFAINHVCRCHNVERPFRCKDCTRAFLLPSCLQQHITVTHRPGLYACPFCNFRSHYLGGFKRHCGRCNGRGGGGGGGVVGVRGKEGEEGKEKEEEEGEEGKENEEKEEGDEGKENDEKEEGEERKENEEKEEGEEGKEKDEKEEGEERKEKEEKEEREEGKEKDEKEEGEEGEEKEEEEGEEGKENGEEGKENGEEEKEENEPNEAIRLAALEENTEADLSLLQLGGSGPQTDVSAGFI